MSSARGSGLFITFEGGEGAGKTTLIKRVESYFKERSKDVISTREPGGTKAAEDIRNLVVTGDKDRWDAVSETALFLTARRTHVEQLIKPALANGSIVLCDRFADSTLVYQGIAKKLGLDFVGQLSKMIVGDIVPDKTFLIDIEAKIGLKRTYVRNAETAEARGAAGNETRFEDHGLAFHEAIRQGFLTLAEAHKQRMVVVDGAASEDAVFAAVKTHLDGLV